MNNWKEKKISYWINSSKSRNKKRSKFNRYYVPSKLELLGALNDIIDNNFLCPECGELMEWKVNGYPGGVISLHHINGGFRLMCYRCNKSLGEKETRVEIENEKSFTCAIREPFFSQFNKIKTNYSPGRKGALLEDMIRFCSDNKDFFWKYLDIEQIHKLKQ